MEATSLDTLFTAFDFSALQGKVVAAIVLAIGLQLVFMGWKYIRKIGSRA